MSNEPDADPDRDLDLDAAKEAGGAGQDEEAGGRARLLRGVRRQAAVGAAAGMEAATKLGRAAQALHLEVVATGLRGQRVLVGHVLGMHLDLRAGGLHGPRQTPAVVYLFADALAVRPSDDAPMSTVPLLGLHMVFPPLAVTRWLYKAGRIEHANLDLVKVAGAFEATLPSWTVDDFAEADPKLEVHRGDSLVGPVQVYQHLGFAHLSLPVPGRPPLRLQSTLPPTAEGFTQLWELWNAVAWPQGITMKPPDGGGDDHGGAAPSPSK